MSVGDLRRIFLGGAVALLGSGCGGSTAPPASESSADDPLRASADTLEDASRCEYKDRPDREAKESVGLGSLRHNIRRVYAVIGKGDERRLVLLCREVDSNLDGKKDVFRTFNEKGESLREVADADFDGKLDTWVTFAAGHMAKVEIDTDRDGNPDEFRFYVKGKLSRVQRDSDRDGKPDVWEIYEDGALRRMGHDLDHDGHVDRWDRDEVAERAALERELQEEEKRKKEAATDGESAGGGSAVGKDAPKKSPPAPSGSASAPTTGKGSTSKSK